MAFQPAPGIASFVVNQRYYNEPLVNVLHFALADSPITQSDLIALASYAAASWIDAFLPLQNENLSVESYVATDLSIQGGAQFTLPAAPADVGQVDGQGLPASVALCGTLRTDRIGRSYRGRIYFAGMNESHIDGNLIAQPFYGNWQAALGGFRASMEGAGSPGEWVVLSRTNNNVQRPVAVGTPISTALFRNNRVDSQRRRLPGR